MSAHHGIVTAIMELSLIHERPSWDRYKNTAEVQQCAHHSIDGMMCKINLEFTSGMTEAQENHLFTSWGLTAAQRYNSASSRIGRLPPRCETAYLSHCRFVKGLKGRNAPLD
eukprot:jgi/Botrbrau1/19144/Bobra.0077s0056.1